MHGIERRERNYSLFNDTKTKHTYLANSREGLARVSAPANSSPVAEDDRDLIASGLLGVELLSLATVNSEDEGRVVLCSCCLLMRRDAIEASDCFRS